MQMQISTPPDPAISATLLPVLKTARLRKHADYCVVYGASRKHQSSSLSYFYWHPVHEPVVGALQPDLQLPALKNARPGAALSRFGITVPRAIGPAVLRNRIKRRVRVIARRSMGILPAGTDLVLHPRPVTATMPFAALERELRAVFTTVAQRIAAQAVNTPLPRQPRRGKNGKGRPA